MSLAPSLSPANILQRLQELKTWQENHEELLKRTRNVINASTVSDYDTIKGLSAFDSTLGEETLPKTPQNAESQAISPTKSFDQLLEEKLSEDPGPKQAAEKPKKPFLKKGTGLQRYRMTHKPKAQSRDKPKMTPLRAPDFAIKPKATWTRIDETEPENVTKDDAGEQTLYEKALEKELLIFEALEERADNSSFCSTNSSVMRILSSTPSKKSTQPPIAEEKRVCWESQSDEDDFIESNLPKTDIANILMRLKSISENSVKTARPPTINESTEDERWSSSEPLSDTSISSSDLEKTLKVEKRDVAVGTTESGENDCTICGEKYQQKMTEYDRQIEEIIRDRNKINLIKTELEQKERDFTKIKKQFEDEKTELLHELETEKKKLVKERQVYQSYIKDSQNRPNKKERQEISNLKQETADLRETLKLKESKNGMTQARLRNQIKQLEKENLTLKDEIEKLTKENAKLTASQKLNRRPSDTKILHEINKNVSKLAQKSRKSDDKSEKDKDDSLLEVEKQYESTSRKDAEPKKIVKVLEDGSKYTKYPNGSEKTVSQDGNFVKMKFFNGDIQETNLIDGAVKYFFSDKNIWQTTYPDGFELVEFPDGTTEKRHVDGKCEVTLPDDVIQITSPDGSQETRYPDGSVVTIQKNGDRTLFLPNGQKEIETKEFKKREYPDGTVKILYPDGAQETRYSNGRVRIKDQTGTLILDTQS